MQTVAFRTVDRIKRDTKRKQESFAKTRKAEAQYARALRGVAKQVGQITRGFSRDPIAASSTIQATLERYADVLKPWAKVTAERVLADVARRDEAVWAKLARDMGRTLRKEIETAPTGKLLQDLLDEQVTLITSLPLEAAQRVHKLTVGGMTSATRKDDIAREILLTGSVTESRANLIARTEVGRTASGLTEARALHVGSEGYIWRTSGDSDVRKEHKKLNGKFFRWDTPPVAGPNNMRYHAGQGPNCRCYPEPVIPEEEDK